jgi:hypothetical protein
MTNREFVLWLWGFLELCTPQPITRKMLYIIRNHMNLVLAVDKEFGAFNQQIYDRVSYELTLEDLPTNTELFDELKSMVYTRLMELEEQNANV